MHKDDLREQSYILLRKYDFFLPTKRKKQTGFFISNKNRSKVF